MRSVFYCFLFNVVGLLADNSDDWWKHTIIYQVYPRSFQDSDGDGVGDLKGITSRLDYFLKLGVGAIWLSPIYKSPMKDFGYDVSNHTDIDPQFGTMNDFDDLVQKMHKKGLKLIMDFIPNHTSDLHPWFLNSKQHPNGEFGDYYNWHNGKVDENGNREAPNNWVSVFSEKAWTFDDNRNQFYLHQFLKEQPDLNFKNSAVQQEQQDVLRFWLKRGVDGFRVDAIVTLFENDALTDAPRSNRSGVLPHEYEYLQNKGFTAHDPRIHDVMQTWRNVLDEFEQKYNKHPYMVVEAYDDQDDVKGIIMPYYHSGADQPFNMGLVDVINKQCGPICIKKSVDDWISNMPRNKWANFVMGNHDRDRVASKKGPQYASALNILLLTLPGTPTTYYGEELGMINKDLTFEETVDPWGKNQGRDLYARYSRDPCRTPMQWDGTKNSGFSSAQKTWLPLHENHASINVKSQINDKSGRSSLQVYMQAARIRQNGPFRTSTLAWHKCDANILSYVRHDNLDYYLVVMNLGREAAATDFSVTMHNNVFKTSNVALATAKLTHFWNNKRVSLSNIHLEPGDAIVLKLNKSNDEL